MDYSLYREQNKDRSINLRGKFFGLNNSLTISIPQEIATSQVAIFILSNFPSLESPSFQTHYTRSDTRLLDSFPTAHEDAPVQAFRVISKLLQYSLTKNSHQLSENH